MAEDEIAVIVSEVHAIALAVFPIFAIGAIAFTHPRSIPIEFESLLPDVHKVILIDIALMIICPYAGASGNTAVAKHGTD